jgi:uncharacterized membrane protein YGL010W
MTTLESILRLYGAYHRDRRNVATHVVGVPMIVLAVEVLLSRPMPITEHGWLTPACVLSVLAAIYYLRLDIRLGGVMAALLALCAWIGLHIALQSTAIWLGWGLGLFVAGWAIQFVGHGFEGRKPAFFDDLRSLLVGPLFVVAELAFMLGLRKELQARLHDPA